MGRAPRRDEPYVLRGAATCVVPADASLVGMAGERHSESAKIRMEPPAVRTYSTFPAEIQL